MTYTGKCVIEVSGEGCANCLTLMPILKKLTDDRPELTLYHIEADESTAEFLERYAIDRVPTILLVENDREIARCRGYQPEEILELWLDAKFEL